MKDVFIKKETPAKNSYQLGTILGKNKTAGDVGIEIEVEGSRLPHSNDELVPFWTHHTDHSLRGEDNAEYVLTKPVKFETVEKALDSLWAVFDKFKSRLDESNRTSVHIHLNCQNFHLSRLASFAALYFCFEELLTEWCGDHRVGNLFCLRGKDAPAIITTLKKFLLADGAWDFTDGYHYSGFNLHALKKFGSVEIRTMRGTPDKQQILDWIMMLRRLYDMSGEFSDPRDVIGEFSGQGAMSYFERCLGPYAGVIQKGIGWTDDQIEMSVYQGVRLAQDIAYCRDWSCLRNAELKDDPFGRSPKAVMKKMGSSWTGPSNPATLDQLQTYVQTYGQPDEPQWAPTPPSHVSWGEGTQSVGVEPTGNVFAQYQAPEFTEEQEAALQEMLDEMAAEQEMLDEGFHEDDDQI